MAHNLTPPPGLRKLLPGLILFALACNTLLPPAFTPTVPSPATLVPSAAPREASPGDTISPTPAASPAPPTATSPPAETATPAPASPSGYHLRPGDVVFHPDPQLYSGDFVSLEISAANADPAWQSARVAVYVGERTGAPLATNPFGAYGIGGRGQATFRWVWDTTGLEGPQTLVIAVEPAGPPDASLAPLDVLTLTVDLLPADQLPMPEPLTRWAQVESTCCVFHYLTGTAAARDIEAITSEADAAFAHVERALGVTQRQKISFTLLSRLLGHGGFATDEISVTYIDRNPAGVELWSVFAHEGTHILDRQLTDIKPTFMTEGLAVYVAGGHFKPEDLDQRAAALLALGRYLPLTDLADDFYPSQHEIGYLEAGAFVKYLVDAYGWGRFYALYRSFRQAPSEAQMLDAALRATYGKGLADLEAEWLDQLASLPVDEDEVEDLRLTVALFDTLRRYQALYDPSAYFLTAWLPYGPEARQRGIVADFVRHPTAPENIALEAMLADAGRALGTREFDLAEALLASVNRVLDTHDFWQDALAADHLALVADLAAAGYEAQTITLTGETATVRAIQTWPDLEALTLTRAPTGWQLTASSLLHSR